MFLGVKATSAKEEYLEGPGNDGRDESFVFFNDVAALFEIGTNFILVVNLRLNGRNGRGGVGLCHASDSPKNVSGIRELWSGETQCRGSVYFER